MTVTRREFARNLSAALLGAGVIAPAAGAGALARDAEAMPSGAGARASALAQGSRETQETVKSAPKLFSNELFEFTFMISLGRAYYGAGNVGKVLYIAGQTEDGDFDSASKAFKDAGDEARAVAEVSLEKGRRVSARQAYMWAQNYYDCATYFADGSKDPSQFEPTWDLHYDCWQKSMPLFDPAGEEINIPYEKTALKGYFFKAAGPAQKRPLVIMVNGSDGSLLDMYTYGGAAALGRGYNVLVFDGPGQGYALWKQKLYFRPDWEKVITPVVDFALKRAEVDPRRIAVIGISQGGYWVPRAAAFERRLAAIVADPGVVDVSTSWTKAIPEPLQKMLANDQKAEFDAALASAADTPAGATLRFRMRPYGFASAFDCFKAVQNYHLRDLAREIHCPTFISAPENEQFWPGQSAELNELLNTTRVMVPFTVSEGADMHCEPKGLGLRDLRIFDWLDATLEAAVAVPVRPVRSAHRTTKKRTT